MKFLPTTKEEMKNLGWDSIDVLLISGDTYLDTSYNGSALVGKWLVEHGFKVGIIRSARWKWSWNPSWG